MSLTKVSSTDPSVKPATLAGTYGTDDKSFLPLIAIYAGQIGFLTSNGKISGTTSFRLPSSPRAWILRVGDVDYAISAKQTSIEVPDSGAAVFISGVFPV